MGEKQILYAVKDASGSVLTLFVSNSLSTAVAKKQKFQQALNKRFGDEVLTVAEATSKEVRNFEVAGHLAIF